MSKWLIEATIPIKTVIKANEEHLATLKSIEKISKTYDINYDQVNIENKTKVKTKIYVII